MLIWPETTSVVRPVIPNPVDNSSLGDWGSWVQIPPPRPVKSGIFTFSAGSPNPGTATLGKSLGMKKQRTFTPNNEQSLAGLENQARQHSSA